MNDEPEYIEVDMFVMGAYLGRRKIARRSIAGAMLSGDDPAPYVQALHDDLARIAGDVTHKPTAADPPA